jgi:hypothetical protein
MSGGVVYVWEKFLEVLGVGSVQKLGHIFKKKYFIFSKFYFNKKIKFINSYQKFD